MNICCSGMSIVFGACSPIGRAIVTRLSCAGHKVAAVDVDGKAAKALQEELSKQSGVNVLGIGVSEDEETTIKDVAQLLGGTFDGLVVVPPQNDTTGDIIDSSILQFNTVFAQRLTIPFRFAKAAIPILRKSISGSVVFVNSSTAYTPFVDLGLYSAASCGLLGLAKNLSVDPSVLPVRVNSVVMSTVYSDGSRGQWDDKEKESALSGILPLGRLGSPVDVASAVQFLLSHDSRYITGEALILNGGMHLRL